MSLNVGGLLRCPRVRLDYAVIELIAGAQEEGMRVDEIPVDMRPRGSGESKLQGRKAVLVAPTIAATLLAVDRWRRA